MKTMRKKSNDSKKEHYCSVVQQRFDRADGDVIIVLSCKCPSHVDGRQRHVESERQGSPR